MSRAVLGLDRLATFVLGLVLVAAGAGITAWATGQLTRIWAGAPDTVSTARLTNAFGASWWAAAAAAAAVVLGLLGLWWLVAHIPRRSAGGPLRLSGSDRSGALSVDGSAAASTAAEVLAQTPGVRSASGKVVSERGALIAEISVTAEPDVDLTELAEAVESVTGDLNAVLGRSDLRGRVGVHIARRQRSRSRVS